MNSHQVVKAARKSFDKYPRAIQRDKDLTNNQKAILHVLTKYVRANWVFCRPAHETIARECNLCRKTVTNNIRILEEREYIKVERRHRSTSRYFFTEKILSSQPPSKKKSKTEQNLEALNTPMAANATPVSSSTEVTGNQSLDAPLRENFTHDPRSNKVRSNTPPPLTRRGSTAARSSIAEPSGTGGVGFNAGLSERDCKIGIAGEDWGHRGAGNPPDRREPPLNAQSKVRVKRSRLAKNGLPVDLVQVEARELGFLPDEKKKVDELFVLFQRANVEKIGAKAWNERIRYDEYWQAYRMIQDLGMERAKQLCAFAPANWKSLATTTGVADSRKILRRPSFNQMLAPWRYRTWCATMLCMTDPVIAAEYKKKRAEKRSKKKEKEVLSISANKFYENVRRVLTSRNVADTSCHTQ